MCGITGFLERPATLDRTTMLLVVDQMNSRLRHRGPDDSGVWVSVPAGVALGHRRLSIVDLSVEGHQPMFSSDERFVIVFNGEIYNFLEIREELEKHNYKFRGHSDTEVMLAAFDRWGIEEATQRFNGMFAIALWDQRDRTLYLSRDRLGKKPLYYGWMGSTFLFGSELKALRAHPGFSAPIEPGAVALFFRLGYIPAPYSVYQGIAKLPPGTILTLREKDRAGTLPSPVAFWSAEQAVGAALADPFRGSYEDAQNQLEALLSDAVRLRMIADVPLGAFLSGGIDSSLVVALMQAQNQGRTRTFSIGFEDAALDESEHARAVARHLDTQHTELYATAEEGRKVVPRLAEMYDEPFADSSQIPTYLVSSLTRGQVTVSLSGDGGDEFFGGYGVYASNLRFREKYGRLPKAARKALAHALEFMPGSRMSRLASVIGFDTDDQIHHSLVSYWNPHDVVPGVPEPETAFTSSSQIALPSFLDRMMYLDSVTYLPDDILAKVDRASMAVALEVRCPILDYRVYEFAWRLPMEMKIKNGEGKRILKDLLYRRVPRELVDRPKQGFAVPAGEWIRGPLREWAEDLLSAASLRRSGLIDVDVVRGKWKRHLSGAEDAASQLWIALMFQSWLSHQHCEAAEPVFASSEV